MSLYLVVRRLQKQQIERGRIMNGKTLLQWVGTLVVCLVLLMFFAGPVAAVPITYTFSATGSGTLDDTPFSDAAFTITVYADTDNVVMVGPGVLIVPDDLSVIDLEGFGELVFTTPKRVFDNQNVRALGFSEGLDSADLLDIRNDDFATYDLTTDFGPDFDPNPFPIWQNPPTPTDQGPLSFYSAHDVTFIAQVGE